MSSESQTEMTLPQVAPKNPEEDDWPTDYFAQCVRDMAETVTKLELCNWFLTESPPEDRGYMWWGHENVARISNALPDNPHSGASFACCMRNIQYIAKNGWVAWKANYMKNKN